MTNTSSISPALKRTAEILERIQNSIKNDRGAKADLKRSLTGEPRHRRAVYPLILPYLSETEAQYNHEQWLLVISFLGYYPQNINPETKLTFGDSARRLLTEASSKGPERRFRTLLETSLEDLRSPLTAMVRLMKSKGIPIDYPQLLQERIHSTIAPSNWEQFFIPSPIAVPLLKFRPYFPIRPTQWKPLIRSNQLQPKKRSALINKHWNYFLLILKLLTISLRISRLLLDYL